MLGNNEKVVQYKAERNCLCITGERLTYKGIYYKISSHIAASQQNGYFVLKS